MVPRWRWIARIQLAGRDRNASGDISTVGKPSTSDAKLAPIRPRSWYSGSQLTNTSSGLAFTAAPIARTLAIRFACDSTTPLGLPVLPEVYCRKPDVAGLAVHRVEFLAPGGFLQVGRNQNHAQRLHLRAQQVGERLRLRDRDHDRRAGALQDPDVARHVVFDRREPRRRVQRHRHAAREQHAVERVQVLLAGGQHDRHHLPGLQARLRELRRVAHRAVPQRAVAERKFLLLLVHEHRQPVRLALDVVFERLGQRARLRFGGRAHALGLHQAGDAAVRGLARVAGAGEQEAQQVARRFAGRQRLLGQARAELLLQAQHQLDAREAVEAELLFQRAVERQLRRRDVRARFLRHRGDDLEQALRLDLCWGLIHRRFPGCGECTPGADSCSTAPGARPGASILAASKRCGNPAMLRSSVTPYFSKVAIKLTV